MTEFYKLARPLMRGVKCQIRSEQVDFKNRMIKDMFSGLPQFTGEIVVGNPIDPTCHEVTQEFLDDEQLMFPFIFWVYDMKTTKNYSLRDRLQIVEPMILPTPPWIQYVDHELVQSKAELDAYAKKVVTGNFFPGIVLREPYGTFGTQDEELYPDSLGLELQ